MNNFTKRNLEIWFKPRKSSLYIFLKVLPWLQLVLLKSKLPKICRGAQTPENLQRVQNRGLPGENGPNAATHYRPDQGTTSVYLGFLCSTLTHHSMLIKRFGDLISLELKSCARPLYIVYSVNHFDMNCWNEMDFFNTQLIKLLFTELDLNL